MEHGRELGRNADTIMQESKASKKNNTGGCSEGLGVL